MKKELYEIIDRMTLQQKIGQLIVGQAQGTEMTGEFEAYIRKYQLCGYRVDGSNIKSKVQVRKFTKEINKLYEEIQGVEPLLASDQEGGALSVFGKLMTEFPGNMSLGATDDANLAYLQGNVSGYELSEMGINMAFAPVADVNLQADNPVIGVRSFGDNGEKVSEFCKKYTKGLNSGGVAGCGKHFPGHGNTVIDSHKALPSNLSSMEYFTKTELIPFMELVKEEVDSLMVSHVLYPNITYDTLPASLSDKIINGILRRQLKYKGVVITDDLEMKAVTNQYKMSQAARMFILAGGDILLINCTREGVIEAYESLISAVNEGVIGIDRINESVARVLELKQKMKEYAIQKQIQVGNHQNLSQEISKKAVTLIRDKGEILPLKEGNKILLIIPGQVNLSEADTTGGMENNLFKYISQYCPNSKMIKTVLGKDSNMNEILMLAKECDEIIQCTINCVRFPEQIKILEQVSQLKPTVAIMLRDPYDAMLIQEDIAAIAAYSAIDTNMQITCDLIFGKYSFSGRLPVTF